MTTIVSADWGPGGHLRVELDDGRLLLIHPTKVGGNHRQPRIEGDMLHFGNRTFTDDYLVYLAYSVQTPEVVNVRVPGPLAVYCVNVSPDVQVSAAGRADRVVSVRGEPATGKVQLIAGTGQLITLTLGEIQTMMRLELQPDDLTKMAIEEDGAWLRFGEVRCKASALMSPGVLLRILEQRERATAPEKVWVYENDELREHVVRLGQPMVVGDVPTVPAHPFPHGAKPYTKEELRDGAQRARVEGIAKAECQRMMAKDHAEVLRWWNVDLKMLTTWRPIVGCDCPTCKTAKPVASLYVAQQHLIAAQVAREANQAPRAVMGCRCCVCLGVRSEAVGRVTERLLGPTAEQIDDIKTAAAEAYGLSETLMFGKVEVPLVERDLACATCRRFYAKVRAEADARIEVVCPGCEREGRA